MRHFHKVGGAALDIVMPMHLLLDSEGTIVQAGPTVTRLRPECDMRGRGFFDVFAVRRPRNFDLHSVDEAAGSKIHLHYRTGRRTALKGVIVALHGREGFLVNLSFGIDVIEAVRDYHLSAADFAATDLAVEMLYLVEAKSAVMEESRNLNLRLQRAKMAAEEQAFTDPLTGVRNRRALDQTLARMIGSGTAFTLMHLDLDYFKEVNDSLGHAAGDHVLRCVARRLHAELRAEDMIVRVGGDEFVIILNGLTETGQIEAIAQRLIERIEEPVQFEGTACRVSTSVGSTTSLRYRLPQPELMHRDADAALYASKRSGRRRHVQASEGMILEAMPAERRLVARPVA